MRGAGCLICGVRGVLFHGVRGACLRGAECFSIPLAIPQFKFCKFQMSSNSAGIRILNLSRIFKFASRMSQGEKMTNLHLICNQSINVLNQSIIFLNFQEGFFFFLSSFFFFPTDFLNYTDFANVCLLRKKTSGTEISVCLKKLGNEAVDKNKHL